MLAATGILAVIWVEFSSGKVFESSDKIWVHDCLLTTQRDFLLTPEENPYLLSAEIHFIKNERLVSPHSMPVHFVAVLKNNENHTSLPVSTNLASSQIIFKSLMNIGTIQIPEEKKYTLQLTAYLPAQICKDTKIESLSIQLRARVQNGTKTWFTMIIGMYIAVFTLLIAHFFYSTRRKGETHEK